jgi:hypothetical protein
MATLRDMEPQPRLWYDARQDVNTRGTNRLAEGAP